MKKWLAKALRIVARVLRVVRKPGAAVGAEAANAIANELNERKP